MHLVIVGNGVAGVSTALRYRRHDPTAKITMISGESKYHYSRPALMYIFMGHMRYQDTKPYEDRVWSKNRIDLMRAWVTNIDAEAKTIALQDGSAIAYDKLVLATGSKPNKFGWPGQDLDGVQGLWGLYDLEKLYKTVERTKRGIIVGGGLIGIELAEMIHSRGIATTLLVRESSYWSNVLNPEESTLVNDEIRRHGVELRLQQELDEILDDGKGRVRGIRTKSGEEFDCEFVGLTAGVSPNVDLAKAGGVDVGRGILVNDRFQTSLPDVFAAGDCAEIVRPEAERNLLQQVWYTGKMQGEVLGDLLAGEGQPYEEITWYNSAKFFGLEDQTTGLVHRHVDREENLFYQHPEKPKSIRIVHQDGVVIGVQTMGIRYRHRVCQRWIENSVPLTTALNELEEANFDPEFYSKFEDELRRVRAQEVAR